MTVTLVSLLATNGSVVQCGSVYLALPRLAVLLQTAHQTFLTLAFNEHYCT